MSSNAILERLKTYPGGQGAREAPVDSVQDATLLQRFQDNLSLSRAQVLRVKQAELVGTIHRVLDEHAIKRLCYGLEVAARSWLAELPAGIEGICYARPVESFRRELFSDMDAGLSGCDAALADTGTLVLGSSVKRPRLLSLVPPLHIAVVREDQVYAGMAEWLRVLDAARLPSNLVLISGPSKSADIEQVLAYGVHGPKALVVLLVESE